MTFGLDTGLLGGLLGIGIIAATVIILALFDADGTVQVFSVIAISAGLVVTGLFPTWVIVVLAIIGGILVFREITDG